MAVRQNPLLQPGAEAAWALIGAEERRARIGGRETIEQGIESRPVPIRAGPDILGHRGDGMAALLCPGMASGALRGEAGIVLLRGRADTKVEMRVCHRGTLRHVLT